MSTELEIEKSTSDGASTALNQSNTETSITPKIHELPEQLINQIAAGEVVERPASVLKELIENSIDAKADQITIEIQDENPDFLKVSDNGIGMEKDDAHLCFKRHTTSKIHELDDLYNIRSLGFRGEALASICSVSKVKLETKTTAQIQGTVIMNEGGRIIETRPAGLPNGTTITVSELFFNTPARKKFLKNISTEYQHMVDMMTSIALAYPQISFKLIHNQKIIFDLPKTNDDLVRIRGILGKNIADELIPVFYGHSDLKIRGYIGKPLTAKTSRNDQYFYVNNREFRSHVLSFAVKQTYHSLIPKDKHPVFLLFFELDPSQVDVNVHPRKQEVKFINEKAIFSAITQACTKALETYVLSPKIISNVVEDYEANRSHAQNLTTQKYSVQETPLKSEYIQGAINFTENFLKLSETPALEVTEKIELQEEKITPVRIQNFGPSNEILSVPDEKITEKNSYEIREEKEEIIPLAQLKNSYILCSQGKSLVIIDQHAAHERIKYTEILAEFDSKEIQKQPLLLPEQFELSLQEQAVIAEHKTTLDSFGFEFEPFGGNTYIITTKPAYLNNDNLVQTFLGLLHDLKNEHENGNHRAAIEKSLTYLACRSAVKFGDPLNMDEMNHIVKKLMTLALPYTCPHGRPTMISMDEEELKLRFKRDYRS